MALGTWHIGGLYAQVEGRNWLFGNKAYITFQQPFETWLTPSNTPGSVMTQVEGCASISDNNGELLFYTDGVRVWNKEHTLMPYFTSGSNFLNGSITSTQSAAIIKKPGDNNIYYIFTAPGILPQGCPIPSILSYAYYSTVDISQDNGLGNITNANSPLNTSPIFIPGNPVPFQTPVSERLCIARGDNTGEFYWAIYRAYSNDAISGTHFYAYRITSSGVSPNPVISNVGSNQLSSCAGQMKVSPCGTRVAYASTQDNLVEVFGFNPSNGNVFALPNNQNGTISFGLPGVFQPYGLEFSPNGQLLYVSTLRTNTPPVFLSTILQFNLAANPIQGSRRTVAQKIHINNPDYAALQLAPNGSIYAANFDNINYLSEIRNPNALQSTDLDNSTNFILQAVQLATNTSSRLGLPSFPNNFFACCTCDANDPCDITNLRFFTTFRKTCVLQALGNGVIAATAIGGHPPYEYSIDGGNNWQNSGVFNNLLGGFTYNIRVRDANGCTIMNSIFLKSCD